jgi:hypothetical protein
VSGPAVILLHPDDNVVVCARPVRAGELLEAGGLTLGALQDVPTGHKIALRSGTTTDKVIKYGMPIGSFTCPVDAGEWVHLHNMKSDYIDAHTRAGRSTGAP